MAFSDRPFRFGVHLWALPSTGWRDRVRRYEELGFSAITLTDHVVVPQWEPIAALGAIAAVTDELRPGTLVLDMALRNPVLVAKAAATLEQLSAGRFELGVGAGYVRRNFEAAGVPFVPAGERIARLEEALLLIRRLWSEPSTTMSGHFFTVQESPMVASEPANPRILIGGGGPSMMRLAGRAADTVSMIPRQSTGDWSVSDSIADSSIERMEEKAAWVLDGAREAGRDPDTIEFNTLVTRIMVGPRVGPAVAAEAASAGVTTQQLADSSLYLCGSGPEVCEQLLRWRDRTGISYISLFNPDDDQLRYLAEQVVAPLVDRRAS